MVIVPPQNRIPHSQASSTAPFRPAGRQSAPAAAVASFYVGGVPAMSKHKPCKDAPAARLTGGFPGKAAKTRLPSAARSPGAKCKLSGRILLPRVCANCRTCRARRYGGRRRERNLRQAQTPRSKEAMAAAGSLSSRGKNGGFAEAKPPPKAQSRRDFSS